MVRVIEFLSGARNPNTLYLHVVECCITSMRNNRSRSRSRSKTRTSAVGTGSRISNEKEGEIRDLESPYHSSWLLSQCPPQHLPTIINNLTAHIRLFYKYYSKLIWHKCYNPTFSALVVSQKGWIKKTRP